MPGLPVFNNPLHTEKIFAKAHEKFLKTTIIYAGDYIDGPVSWDENGENLIDAEDLVDLFMKGVCVFVLTANAFVKPISCVLIDGEAAITCLKHDSADEHVMYHSIPLEDSGAE